MTHERPHYITRADLYRSEDREEDLRAARLDFPSLSTAPTMCRNEHCRAWVAHEAVRCRECGECRAPQGA